MANVNAPFGLRPAKNITAAMWDAAVSMYYIPSSDTNAYFIGDTVVSAAGGDVLTGSSQVVLAGTRNAAYTSGPVRGVIVGIGTQAGNSGNLAPLGADPNALSTTSIPATKTQNYYVWVCDDPNTVFEALVDTIAVTAYNKNCPLFVANVPSVPAFNSASYAQASAAATTQALPLKIVGAPSEPTNDLTGTGAYARVYVIFNQHELGGPNTAGV